MASATATLTPTLTETPTSTLTTTPTETATAKPSATTAATETATTTATYTAIPATDIPSATPPASSTHTEITPHTETPAAAPSETFAATGEQAAIAASPSTEPTQTTATTASSTFTPAASATGNPAAVLATPLPEIATEPSATATPAAAGIAATGLPPESGSGASIGVVPPIAGSVGLPPETLIGAAVVLLILGYVGLYFRSSRAADRYIKGFVITTCPVCQRGQLSVEARQERIFGIPRTRRIARCNECRSLLREIGAYRWRYAVDPLENPTMYKRFNGREIDDEVLTTLNQRPIPPDGSLPKTPPAFVDEASQEDN